MRTLGIIAEYNPFHNGHLYHLQKSKYELNADYCAVIMSGNFVQRGEPAIIHKWKRVEMCLLGGADVVIELPLFYATASAEFFADGAIKLLNATNMVDYLSFGAECPSIKEFRSALDYIIGEPPEYKKLLKSTLSIGCSFPKARALALAELASSKPEIYEAPNNILAIEYLKALSNTKSNITPHIVKRQGSNHNSDNLGKRFSSASAIRKAILSGNLQDTEDSVPPETYRILAEARNIFPIDIDCYSDMLIYKIKSSPASELRNIFDVTEGLENRISSAASNETIRSIISQIKTKRYTFTKIQRILMHILLDITINDMDRLRANGPPYIRILGFKSSAQKLVGKLTENAALPVIINLKKDMQKLDETSKKVLLKEITSTDVYFTKCHEKSLRRVGSEYSFPVVVI